MDLLERIKTQFREKLSDQSRCIVVEEWGEGDKPLNIYYRPMSLKQQNQIYKYVREGSLESMVEQLILCARDSDGSRLFKQAHKTELMNHADPEVISRIIQEMNDIAEISPEDAEKN